MEIFISWSGERSRACADALKVWLPRVIQSLNPWVSTRDIGKGARWSGDIAKQLDQHIYGIICVTPENRNSTWLNFEAGALSKTDASRTFTLLLGLTHSEVEQPLAQFNHTLASKNDVLALMRSINQANDRHLDEDLLLHTFELNWPYLEKVFADQVTIGIPKAEKITSSKDIQPRDEKSMIQEILELVRHQTLYRPAPVRVHPDDSRTEMIERTILNAIKRRGIDVGFRIKARSRNNVVVEFRNPNNSISVVLELSDSMAQLERVIEDTLEKLIKLE